MEGKALELLARTRSWYWRFPPVSAMKDGERQAKRQRAAAEELSSLG